MINTTKFILALGACCTVSLSMAQALPTPPATPIDGGLGLLIAGGTAYGIKKLKDLRSK